MEVPNIYFEQFGTKHLIFLDRLDEILFFDRSGTVLFFVVL